MSVKPTEEQQAILDAFATGENIVIKAGAGCLAADTVINVNRAGKGSQMTIKHVAYQSQGQPVLFERMLNGEVVVQRARGWDPSIPTQVARADGAVVRLGGLKAAWYSGIKETYTVTTETGRTIRATIDHPFLLDSGEFVPLRALRLGRSVQVNTGRSTAGRGPKLNYLYTDTRFHPHQTRRSTPRNRFGVPTHRLVMEADLNGLAFNDYVEILRTDAEVAAGLTYLDQGVHVHHRDHDTRNNSRSNLEVLAVAEHHRRHADAGKTAQVLWQVGVETVVSVTPYGEEPTYDIEVDDDPHNFLANGFVVHNTGKTTTLRMLADSTRDRGIYVAYNKAIADESAGRFPRNVQCRTAHSLAYRAVGADYRDRLGGGFQPLWKLAKYLGIERPLACGQRLLSYTTLARLTLEMVDNFCNSADDEVLLRHRPWVDGLVQGEGEDTVDYHQALALELLPYAEKAWDDLQDPRRVDSPVRFKHDHYLKIWQLTDPKIDEDFILFDEAQDANPVILAVIKRQQQQVVPVGDDAQSIYGWRGAVNALDQFDTDVVLLLEQSFRFGPDLAEFANGFLEQLKSPLRLRGTDAIDTRIGPLDPDQHPRALLTRSNVGGLDALIRYQAAGVKAHLVGGATDIGRFCKAAHELQTTGRTSHRDLIAFSSWDEVVQYCKDDRKNAGDLGTWVSIIERYGIEKVESAIRDQHPVEETADITISTAHKAKGREWDTVRLAEDFTPKMDDDGAPRPLLPGDIMLRYVASTRARFHLDPGPLTRSGVWSDEPGDNVDPSADAGVTSIADEGQIAEGGA